MSDQPRIMCDNRTAFPPANTLAVARADSAARITITHHVCDNTPAVAPVLAPVGRDRSRQAVSKRRAALGERQAPIMTTVVLRNETAFDTFRFSWVGSDGVRCEIQWGEGMRMPLAFRHNFPADVRNAERFGFKPTEKLAVFKAFVQRFADAFEADDDTPRAGVSS